MAISSDLHGYIFSIDHTGALHRNRHGTPGGGPLEFPGLGEQIGTGWGGIQHFGATRVDDQLLLVGVRTTGAVVSAFTTIATLDRWSGVRPGEEPGPRWTGLVSLCAARDGALYGVTEDGELHHRAYTKIEVAGTIFLTGVTTLVGTKWGSRLTLLRHGQRFFDVTLDGELRYQSLLSDPDPVHDTGWVVLSTGWTGYQRVFVGGERTLYAITSEGALVVHRFADDGRSVRLLPRARAEKIGSGWIGWATLPSAVEGYATPQCGVPGDVINFHTAARTFISETVHPTDFHVVYVRLRRMSDGKRGDWDTVIGWEDATFHAGPAPVPTDWLVNGVQWPTSFSYTIPGDLASGLYAARCFDEKKLPFYIPFVVRPATKSAPFAVLANTNTWNAYNSWGGYGKYVRDYPLPRSIPFERPHPGLTPDIPAKAPNPELFNQSNHLLRAELWVLGWLDGLGPDYAYDLYTDRDLHDGIDGLSNPLAHERYKALILTVHPEYWTAEMYDAAKAYQDMGGSILYLGGNGLYEQVLFERSGVGLTIFPFVDWDNIRRDATNEEVRLQCLWRVRGRPERAIIGVGFEECAGPMPDGQPYLLKLSPNESPALKDLTIGIGAGLGATSANTGFCADGWEVDQRGAHTPPAANADDALLALGGCSGMSGEMLYYETGKGGVVFAGSSLSFGGSLAVDTNLQTIVKNILDIALRRQCGAG